VWQEAEREEARRRKLKEDEKADEARERADMARAEREQCTKDRFWGFEVWPSSVMYYYSGSLVLPTKALPSKRQMTIPLGWVVGGEGQIVYVPSRPAEQDRENSESESRDSTVLR
jgi:hypothetical protein